MALASISVPDPKMTLPDWFTEDKTLFYITWYSADLHQANKKREEASFYVRDLDEEIDIQSLTGVDLLRHMFHYFENKRSFKDSRTNRMLGNSTTDKAYFPEFKWTEMISSWTAVKLKPTISVVVVMEHP